MSNTPTGTVNADATQILGSGRAIIEMKNVDKLFGNFQALTNINMNVGEKEVVVVIGPSGSGKSTMIRCINRLEKHDRGEIIVDGITLSNDVRNIQEIRRETGMVFQSFNLFPHLTVLDNITLAPRQVRNIAKSEAEKTAMELLERVKIPEQARKFPGQLSGGQQQRVAVARAVVGNQSMILADEPTGNLDSAHGQEVMEMLRGLNEEGTTIVMVTHSPSHSDYARRIINLFDGHVVTENLRAVG